MNPAWEAVIGLEIHVQLATRSKIFSAAANQFGAPPNSLACPVDLGLPGVLPVLNEAAVRMAVKFGLAIGAEVRRRCSFDRKNYFYPDLPKGYQISQLAAPIVGPGRLEVPLDDGAAIEVRIVRAHLEEDAGKSIHDAYAGQTGIDLNRAGTPLLEVVSAPDLRTPEQAAACFRQLHSLVRYLGICDGDLSQGSMRCDANVSVRPQGREALGERTEIKNINSFRFVEKAVRFEIDRQIDRLEAGLPVVRETRLYDASKDETRPMRGKEFSDDYRYFPDPDLLPVAIDGAFIEAARAELPELPAARRRRFQEALGLSEYDAGWLTRDPDTADYFAAAARTDGSNAKRVANWVMGELTARLNREGLDIGAAPVTAVALGRLTARIEDGTLSSKTAKTVFEALWDGEGEVDAIIEARGLKQVRDTAELAGLIDDILARHPQQAEQFRAGRDKLLGFFVGQAMKATGGKADPRQVNELLKQALGNGIDG
ncbi:MAG: Asp-tRNA(Asn)/Glu-tRNA(Gln) amidotransferase subunit GatB [Gammaproteobacteria bacterium]|nr:Asp-tRNA(Asn)/Glu-tRNA(Gln) amidotransferase subunit GatB [Gammaproteobacteria bacterium]